MKRIFKKIDSYDNFLHLRKDPEIAELLLSKYSTVRLGRLTAHEDARNISDGATSGLSRKERKAKGLQKNQALAHYAVFIPLFLDWLISLRNPLRGKNSKFFASVLSASLSNMKPC